MKIQNVIVAASCVLLSVLPETSIAETPASNGMSLIVASSSGGGLLDSGISVYAQTIDGKAADVVLFKGVQVSPGNHLVGLMIQFQGKGNGNWRPYKDVINFRASLLPGHRYVANGRQQGNHVDVWIADAANQSLASKVLSIDLQPCQFLSCPSPTLSTKSTL